MIDLQLIDFMREELAHTPREFHRYMYDRILWEDRMIGIVGPRGVGKSTMVKQYLLSRPDPERWLYVTADHSWFATHTLTELADDLIKDGGLHLIIDEVHKYDGWSRELKQIYDTHATLQVIFTGSSVLDIYHGAADLSRRALMFHMYGLSFREYLSMFKGINLPVYNLNEIIENKVELPTDYHPLPDFREYLRKGYYPFSSLPGYDIRLQQIMQQTLEVDIPQYAGMNAATAKKLRRLLGLLSESAPYKPNMTSLGQELRVSKNDLPNYLAYLEKGGMIGLLRDETGGMRGLGKVEKVYVDNPNLMYALQGESTDIGNVRETFFYNQMRVNNEIVSSKITDFRIGEHIFEIGGSKKGKRQLEGDPKGIVVRDDIEYGHAPFIPLWHFGLNY